MIEIHCEHCNLKVSAPDSDGGQQAKCPHCGGMNYIPLPEGAIDEIPLAPIDEAAEQRRRQAFAEDMEIQRKLNKERAAPGEPNRRRPRSLDASAPPRAPAPPRASNISDKQVNSLVVNYIVAMAGGRLAEADGIVAQLAPHKTKVSATINEITSNSGVANGYGLPTLPKPVLLGFVKQLQARM